MRDGIRVIQPLDAAPGKGAHLYRVAGHWIYGIDDFLQRAIHPYFDQTIVLLAKAQGQLDALSELLITQSPGIGRRSLKRIGISNAGPVQSYPPPPVARNQPMLSPSLVAAWFAWAIRGASRLLRRALGRCRATKPASRDAHKPPTLPRARSRTSAPHDDN
jgi:hypothetical protein